MIIRGTEQVADRFPEDLATLKEEAEVEAHHKLVLGDSLLERVVQNSHNVKEPLGYSLGWFCYNFHFG